MGGVIGARPHGQLIIECADPLVEIPPLRAHVLDQPPHPRAESIAFLRQDLWQQPLELAPSLRCGDAALQQQGADLVDQGGPLRH